MLAALPRALRLLPRRWRCLRREQEDGVRSLSLPLLSLSCALTAGLAAAAADAVAAKMDCCKVSSNELFMAAAKTWPCFAKLSSSSLRLFSSSHAVYAGSLLSKTFWAESASRFLAVCVDVDELLDFER